MSDCLIKPNDDLRVITRRDDYGHNDGSIIVLRNKTDENCGNAYCIAKAPRYATDKEWQDNADLIIKALKEYREYEDKKMKILHANKAKELAEFNKKEKEQGFIRAVEAHELFSGIMPEIEEAVSKGELGVFINVLKFDTKGLDIALLRKLGYRVRMELPSFYRISWGE